MENQKKQIIHKDSGVTLINCSIGFAVIRPLPKSSSLSCIIEGLLGKEMYLADAIEKSKIALVNSINLEKNMWIIEKGENYDIDELAELISDFL